MVSNSLQRDVSFTEKQLNKELNGIQSTGFFDDWYINEIIRKRALFVKVYTFYTLSAYIEL